MLRRVKFDIAKLEAAFTAASEPNRLAARQSPNRDTVFDRGTVVVEARPART
jgi:hypothetical protein